jgi:hypothetical protein
MSNESEGLYIPTPEEMDTEYQPKVPQQIEAAAKKLLEAMEENAATLSAGEFVAYEFSGVLGKSVVEGLKTAFRERGWRLMDRRGVKGKLPITIIVISRRV